jgi:Arc/MetJ-type ribon-helix-helix transcriptional regulator
MTTVSVSIDEEILKWLDQLIKEGVIKNRSEAVRGGIYSFVKEQLEITSRQELREFLKKKQKKSFQDGAEAIKDVRSEE